MTVMTQAKRSAKAAAKRARLGEEELRHRVRSGIKAKLANLMQWHGIEEQTEAIQLLILNAHAMGPTGSTPLLAVPRHEITISENVARKLAPFVPPGEDEYPPYPPPLLLRGTAALCLEEPKEMTWLFSRALVQAFENSRSSREPGAAFSAATCSAGVPSAPLSMMPTPHKFWHNDKTMESSRLSRFGLTCAVLTESLGEALLTWFRADSRVRTYPLPGMAPELTVSVPASGEKWHESSVKYDLDSSSWRTHRSLFDEALPWSSVTLPSWGMTLAGVLWEPPMSGRPISATESGSLPTPRASMGKHRVAWCRARIGDHRHNLEDFLATQWLEEGGEEVSGLNAHPEYIEWVMGFPSMWTGLNALEMARFHEWQRQHSLFWQPIGCDAA